MVLLEGPRRGVFRAPVPWTLPSESSYKGTSLMRKRPPPKDHHRTLGTVLLSGPRRGVFLMSEVPLQVLLDHTLCGRAYR